MAPSTKRLRAYLSGGMEYAADEGRDWRTAMEQWLTGELGWDVFNPNIESDRFFRTHYPQVNIRTLKSEDLVLYREILARLVDFDCREIAERSDVVVCYWDEAAARGAGTKGELTMAKYFGKPVYLVTSMPHHELPGWVLGCISHTFQTFADLKEHLAKL